MSLFIVSVFGHRYTVRDSDQETVEAVLRSNMPGMQFKVERGFVGAQNIVSPECLVNHLRAIDPAKEKP